jgi:hypothetical protein
MTLIYLQLAIVVGIAAGRHIDQSTGGDLESNLGRAPRSVGSDRGFGREG